MDMATSFSSLHWPAVIAAALSTFLLGGLWYSALFQKQWLESSGVTLEAARAGNKAMIFGGSFVLSFIASLNLALFLGPTADLAFGIAAGAATGIGWVAPAIGVIYLFEQRPLTHWLINGLYWVVAFIVMGAILGGWK